MKLLLNPRSLAQYMLVLMMMLVITSCATMGVPTPKTFNEQALLATGTVDQVQKTASVLLNAKKIGSADAENVIKVADGAMAGIGVARSIAATKGDAAGAVRLKAVTAILIGLQGYLATQGATP